MVRQSITSKQRTWLLDALTLWRDQGIVSEDQTGRILDLYETTTAIAERQRSRVRSAIPCTPAGFPLAW